MKAIRLFVGVTVLGLSGVSYAENVLFEGSVANTCTIATIGPPGQVVTIDEKTLSSGPTEAAVGGAAGHFKAKCTGDGMVKVGIPTVTSAPTGTPATNNSSVVFQSGTQVTTSAKDGDKFTFNGTEKTFDVHMTATSTTTDTLLPGAYGYNVVVTVAAQ